jgi:PDZ domain
MSKPFTTFTILLSTLLLGACASGYQEFYVPMQGNDPASIATLRVAPPPKTPLVERGSSHNPLDFQDNYLKRGYFVIGYSSFNSGESKSDEDAIKQGQVVEADLVLILNPKYTGSVTTSIPLTTPTTSTSYSTGSASVYGPGGPITAYGSGTTTTYGTSTMYVPITVQRSNYAAVYFVKQRFILGAHFRDLNDSERQELQSNRGAVVRLIVDDTPAFNTDILVGDVITSVDDVPISNTQGMHELLDQKRGKQVTLRIFRHGNRLEKAVQLNP